MEYYDFINEHLYEDDYGHVHYVATRIPEKGKDKVLIVHPEDVLVDADGNVLSEDFCYGYPHYNLNTGEKVAIDYCEVDFDIRENEVCKPYPNGVARLGADWDVTEVPRFQSILAKFA